MIKVLFVCLGNICRSPMAEFLLKDYVEKQGRTGEFGIASAATSTEEIGNQPHYGTRTLLNSLGISTEGKRARQLTKKDYEEYDFIIGMEEANMRNMYRMLGKKQGDKKLFRLLEFSDRPRDIADPWYTGNFDKTYQDIMEGLEEFYTYLDKNNYFK